MDWSNGIHLRGSVSASVSGDLTEVGTAVVGWKRYPRQHSDVHKLAGVVFGVPVEFTGTTVSQHLEQGQQLDSR